MTYDQLADNIFLIIFAGMDTSRNLTESSLYKLSMEPGLQKELRDSVRKVVLDSGDGEDYTKYVSSFMLDAFMKEALRVYTPASMSFNRLILKDFELGPYKIYKGDFLIIPFSTLQLDSQLFDKP